jgi:hypothetical protein
VKSVLHNYGSTVFDRGKCFETVTGMRLFFFLFRHVKELQHLRLSSCVADDSSLLACKAVSLG